MSTAKWQNIADSKKFFSGRVFNKHNYFFNLSWILLKSKSVRYTWTGFELGSRLAVIRGPGSLQPTMSSVMREPGRRAGGIQLMYLGGKIIPTCYSSGFLRPQNLKQYPTWFDVYLVNIKSFLFLKVFSWIFLSSVCSRQHLATPTHPHLCWRNPGISFCMIIPRKLSPVK